MATFLLAINKEMRERKPALLGIADLPALISALRIFFGLFCFFHFFFSLSISKWKISPDFKKWKWAVWPVSSTEKRGLYMSVRRRTRRSFCSSLRCQIDTRCDCCNFTLGRASQFGIRCFYRGQRSTCTCVCGSLCLGVRVCESRQLEGKKCRKKKKSIPMWKQTLTLSLHSSTWNALREFRREVTPNESGVSDCSRGTTITVSQTPTSSNTHLYA